ncbi:MBL fold metallo-hydrolase [Streptomyces sp. NPDC020766]|uniref:MBL fold metallo-hydrolase n=1 Tax=Streptomyces sp. NPDC020766 TaxID=3155011 RepID=UPI0033DD4859
MPSQHTRSAVPAARTRSAVTSTVTSRRALVRGTTAGRTAATTAARTAAAAPVVAGVPSAAIAPGVARRGAGAALRWFGTNAWELTFDGRTVLIDPWLTRFSTTGPDGRFDAATPLSVDRAAICRHLRAADLVLVTHGHYDHMGDVPHALERFPRARAVATQTHAHLLSAIGAPADRVVWARGGEYMNFGGFTVRVLPSPHSLSAGTGTSPPGAWWPRPGGCTPSPTSWRAGRWRTR